MKFQIATAPRGGTAWILSADALTRGKRYRVRVVWDEDEAFTVSPSVLFAVDMENAFLSLERAIYGNT